jgi:hypothetical protein
MCFFSFQKIPSQKRRQCRRATTKHDNISSENIATLILLLFTFESPQVDPEPLHDDDKIDDFNKTNSANEPAPPCVHYTFQSNTSRSCDYPQADSTSDAVDDDAAASVPSLMYFVFLHGNFLHLPVSL